jgi:hypothetical protein
MSDQAPTSAANSVRFQRTVTVDPAYAGRMTAATFRYVLFTPGRIVGMAIPSLILAVFESLGVGAGGVATVGVFILVLLALPALYVFVFLIAYFPARKQIAERMPVGSEYSIVMTDEWMRLKDPMVVTDISYQLYKSLRTSSRVVALIPRRGRRPTIVPRDLFTVESLAWLASRLNAV